MNPAKATVVLRANGTCSIMIGGHDITQAVQAVTITAAPDRHLRVTLDVAADVLATPTREQITLPDRVLDALLTLGWTPPHNHDAHELAELGEVL
ncbi:MAG: hypothetical protein L0K86_16135 [Actinomycetia bacterium]|nr:hypothetical protein [Actinomycetes bacterium]